MNLHKEIDEFTKSFKEGNILTRIVMVVSFILALSSLTELSDKIVKWKGFLLDGLKFYQATFVEPASYLLQQIGLSYTEVEIHVATISSICIATGMRVQILGQKVAFRNISKRYGNEVKPSLVFFWTIGITAPISLWLWLGLNESEIHIWRVIFASVFLPVFMILPKFIMTKLGDYEFFEREDFSYFKSYYLYLSSIILIICIFAAINSGLKDNNTSTKSSQVTTEVSVALKR